MREDDDDNDDDGDGGEGPCDGSCGQTLMKVSQPMRWRRQRMSIRMSEYIAEDNNNNDVGILFFSIMLIFLLSIIRWTPTDKALDYLQWGNQ